MVWIAVVLGVFLFYRFVERKHKILTLKIAVGLAVLFGVFAGGFTLVQQFERQRQDAEEPTVEFVGIRLDTDSPGLRPIIEKMLLYEMNTDSTYFRVLDKEAQFLFKYSLFENLYKDDAEQDMYLGPITELRDLKIKFAKGDSSDSVKSKMDEARKKQVSKYLGDIKEMRLGNLSSMAVKIYARFQKLNDDDRKTLVGFLSEEEGKASALVFDKIEAVSKSMSSKLVGKGISRAISFKICNRKDEPLDKVTFDVSGYEEGRSTAHPITEGISYGTSTEFKNDIIIPPNECSTITWTGNFKFYSRYEIGSYIRTY